MQFHVGSDYVCRVRFDHLIFYEKGVIKRKKIKYLRLFITEIRPSLETIMPVSS